MLPIEISFQGGLVSPPDVWPSDLRRGLTRPASGSVGRLRVATTTCHHDLPPPPPPTAGRRRPLPLRASREADAAPVKGARLSTTTSEPRGITGKGRSEQRRGDDEGIDDVADGYF